MTSVNLKKSITRLGIGVALLAIQFSAIAQDVEISDDELTKYVSVMAEIDTLKAGLKAKTSELVKGNELMDKGRTFNALKRAKGDSTAIAGLEVTEEQINAFNEINIQIEAMTTSFKEKYTSLIKDDLGASVYNKIKKGLKSNEELKARYEEVIVNFQSMALDETAETGEG